MTRAVWLHGAGLSAATWDRDRLGDGIALDLPGHGNRPATAPTVEAMAAALLPDLPDRCDLVGHSLGGMIALYLAATWPDRVRRLVLAETAMTTNASPLEQLGSRAAVGLARVLGPDTLAHLAGLSDTPATVEALRSGIRSLDKGSLNDALEAAITFDGRPLAPRITAPTLILVGARNAATHVQGLAMSVAIPDAALDVLPGGHMLHTDCPDAFYGAVRDFLKG